MTSVAPNISAVSPITGTSTATKLVMLPNSLNEYSDMFSVNNNFGAGDANIGGITFQDLQIFYQPMGPFLPSGAAVRVINNSVNVRLFRMVFDDCPIGIALDNSLQVSITNCVVWYSTFANGKAITLGSSTATARETYIANLETKTTVGGTGVSIVGQGAQELRFMNTRIEAFVEGVVIAPSASQTFDVFAENLSIFTFSSTAAAGAALLIQPTGAATVESAVFVGCQFGPTATQTSYTGAGVIVDQSQTDNGVLDQVRFVSCHSCGWLGSGLMVNGGVTALEVQGGYYSCNGQDEEIGPQYGITLNADAGAAPSYVRIVGAACNNKVYSSNAKAWLSASQSYGVSVAAACKYVKMHGCDLTGNVDGALSVTTPDVSVQATDCAGYNDQATQLAIVAPMADEAFSATQTYSYCGPMAFYASGGNVQHIKINSKTTGLAAGAFTLSPGENAELDYTSAPTYYAVGK